MVEPGFDLAERYEAGFNENDGNATQRPIPKMLGGPVGTEREVTLRVQGIVPRLLSIIVLLAVACAYAGDRSSSTHSGDSAASKTPAEPGTIPAPRPVAGSRHPSELTAQNEYPRVRAARRNAGKAIAEMFARAGMKYPPEAIFIRVFKNEKELELWARSSTDETFHLVKTYPICALSGGVGPKRAEGDGQVPEGVYRIARYNPVSRYHLSLGLNYPNDSDRMLGGRNPGSDIFIHGDCVTIGCIPITNALIEELYVVALDAHARQQRIPVHVFPLRMDEKGMSALRKYADAYDLTLLPFWENLQAVYRAFEECHRPPDVRIDGAGRYLIGPP